MSRTSKIHDVLEKYNIWTILGVFWPIFTPGRLIRESFWLAESTFYQLITFKVVCTTLIATIIHLSVLYSKIQFFQFWGHFRGLGLMTPLISTCINYLSKLLYADNFSMLFKKSTRKRLLVPKIYQSEIQPPLIFSRILRGLGVDRPCILEVRGILQNNNTHTKFFFR